MSNANFSQEKKQASGPGGFDAGSYREVKSAPAEAALTPVQKTLAKLENALPAALGKQAAAAALCAVIMLVSAVGFGGGKLRAKYAEAKQWYSVGLEADGGYTLEEELSVRVNAAANVLTTAGNTLGETDEVQAARAALTAFQEAVSELDGGTGDMHAVYAADTSLAETVGAAYDSLMEQQSTMDASRLSAVQSERSRFNSAGRIIGNLSYNAAVTDYQKETGGFPAVLLKGLFGIKEVETFA